MPKRANEFAGVPDAVWEIFKRSPGAMSMLSPVAAPVVAVPEISTTLLASSEPFL